MPYADTGLFHGMTGKFSLLYSVTTGQQPYPDELETGFTPDVPAGSCAVSTYCVLSAEMAPVALYVFPSDVVMLFHAHSPGLTPSAVGQWSNASFEMMRPDLPRDVGSKETVTVTVWPATAPVLLAYAGPRKVSPDMPYTCVSAPAARRDPEICLLRAAWDERESRMECVGKKRVDE